MPELSGAPEDGSCCANPKVDSHRPNTEFDKKRTSSTQFLQRLDSNPVPFKLNAQLRGGPLELRRLLQEHETGRASVDSRAYIPLLFAECHAGQVTMLNEHRYTAFPKLTSSDHSVKLGMGAEIILSMLSKQQGR